MAVFTSCTNADKNHNYAYIDMRTICTGSESNCQYQL